MVPTRRLRIITGLMLKQLILVLLAGLWACDEYIGFSVDCSECISIKPDSANLIIELSITEEYPEVAVKIFSGEIEGEIEKDFILYEDKVSESPYYAFVPVDKFYSVEAVYEKASGEKILAYDGDKLKVKHVPEACDVECWIVTGGELDTRLKYDK